MSPTCKKKNALLKLNIESYYSFTEFPYVLLNLHTLTLVCIFSILFSIHFLGYLEGEFVEKSRACLVGDH